ncbi:MAG: beta-ketoacyl synthase N-terminal-like domain-containing protein [Candidatus Omnitrophota bacterium]|jgi:hypothetical protein
MAIAITALNNLKLKGKLNKEMLLASINDLIKRSDVSLDKEADNFAIFIGSSINNFFIKYNNMERYKYEEIYKFNPAKVPESLISYLGGYLSIKLGAKGCTNTFSSGQSSGTDALLQAGYFLKRNKKNKALIVELQEKIGDKLKPSISGVANLIIENECYCKHDKEIYGLIDKAESLFEKKGEVKAILAAAKKIHPSNKKIMPAYDVFSCGAGGKVLLRNEFSNYFMSLNAHSKLKFHWSLGDYGIFFLSDILKQKNSYACLERNNKNILWLNVGQDSNSFCASMRAPIHEAGFS